MHGCMFAVNCSFFLKSRQYLFCEQMYVLLAEIWCIFFFFHDKILIEGHGKSCCKFGSGMFN